jgi:hypothetical protein
MRVHVYQRRRSKSPQQRFWEKVEKSPSGCWVWTARRSRSGYGEFRYGTTVRAHRFSWLIANGSIPDGMFVCHRCDTPACVNPAHLFLGTADDNNKDRDRKGRAVFARGESNGATYLTWDQVRGIRARYSEIRNAAAISRELGVAYKTVVNIVRRHTWNESEAE